MFQEVTHKHLAIVVEECDALMLMYTSSTAARMSFLQPSLLSRLSNSVIFGASLVDGFGFLYFYHCRVFGNLVITQAKAKVLWLWDGKCGIPPWSDMLAVSD